MKGKNDGRRGGDHPYPGQHGEQPPPGARQQHGYSMSDRHGGAQGYHEWVSAGDQRGGPGQAPPRLSHSRTDGHPDLRGGPSRRAGTSGEGPPFRQQNNGLHMTQHHQMQRGGGDRSRGGGGGGGGGGLGGDHYYVDDPLRSGAGGMLPRGGGRQHSAPHLHQHQQQHEQHMQHRQHHHLQHQAPPHSNHPHHHNNSRQQQQHQQQQHRHHPSEGGQQHRAPPSAMSSRRGGGGTDLSQLPSSPEHNMGLKAHAAEFVPGGGGSGDGSGGGQKQLSKLGLKGSNNSKKKGGGGGGKSSSRGLPVSEDTPSDLTAFAQEFVPGGRREGGNGPEGDGDGARGGGGGAGAEGGASQPQQLITAKMVPVVRGGTIYFVPETEALATDELVAGPDGYTVGQEIEEGFSWANESTAVPAPQRRSMHSTAVPEHLWAEFQSQSLSVLRQLPPDDERLKEVPPQFYAAFPLDSASKTRGTAGSFGYPSETYKVIQHHTGQAYALRRFDTARTTTKIVALATEIWLSMPEHPGITRPREVFIHRNALIFVCDFHPGAETLAQRFIEKQGGMLSEAFIWRVICQLLGALRATHAAGTALRNIHPSRVLYCRVGDRVRVNWAGCLDVLEFETRKQVPELQQQDMHDLGMLILSLACRSPATTGTRGESLAFLSQHYSPELHNLAGSLVTKPPSVFEVCMATAHHTMDALENTLTANDALQCHLSNEYDNGRLLRLLLKLGTLNERPDQGGGEWAETGERYILKLFRDYCFHQVNSEDEPVLDFGHIYQTLARLDAGDDEKILLTSRDKRSLLVVSYADVKRCLEEAFADIFGQASAAAGSGSGGSSAAGTRGTGGKVTGNGNHQSSSRGGAAGVEGSVLPGGRGEMSLGMGRAAGSVGVPVAALHGGLPIHGGIMGPDGTPMVGGLPHHGIGHPHAVVGGGHGHGHGAGGIPMVLGVGHHSHVHSQQHHAAAAASAGHHPHGMGMPMGMVSHHPAPPPPPPHGGPMPPY